MATSYKALIFVAILFHKSRISFAIYNQPVTSSPSTQPSLLPTDLSLSPTQPSLSPTPSPSLPPTSPPSLCGNHNRDLNEDCDDGNNIDTDDCPNSCRLFDLQIFWRNDTSFTDNYEWEDVAMSSTGAFQSAVAIGSPDFIWKSSNYGMNWSVVLQSTTSFGKIAMSNSGQYQTAILNEYFATSYMMSIWNSSNFGTNWTEQTSFQNIFELNDFAMNGNGSIMLISFKDIYSSHFVFKSLDYGETWTDTNLASFEAHVAVSDSGVYQTVVSMNGFIRTSNDTGATWYNTSIDFMI